ncbi:amidohydrolase family [Fusarium albosuccineum]|uniref:Amidohydrolase family n=1 Tax=Fusarium albosuccineum TaxID=1237068 RepID=A0A8H4L569_9HYPO|nr:amidohydrolase family [Fusarium albosuccineum]
MAKKSPFSLLAILFAATGSLAANSTLFKHGTVIGFDAETQTPKPLYNTSILVTGDTIAAIFGADEDDSIEIPQDTEIVSAENKIISPGFIDTHRHLWQTTYRTIASNITLLEYMARYSPRSRVPDLFTAEEFYLSQLVGLWEALSAGVTSLLDHAHNVRSREIAEASLDAYADSGARVWFGYGFDPSDDFPIAERAAHVRQLISGEQLSGGLVEMGMAFDTWTTASEAELEEVIKLLKENQLSILTSHWLDGPWAFGHNPSLFQRLDILNESFPIVFSHGTYISPAEHKLLKDYNHYVSITPESEMHFGHTNYESDLIMDQAALGIPRNNPISVNQAFHLATRAGAQALGRDDLGTLEVGAKADVVTFNGESINLIGWKDPVAAIILHSHAGDVVDVMVGGNFVKRNGTLTAESLRNVTERFRRSAARIQEEAVKVPYVVQDGLVPNALVEAVDAVRGPATGY